MAKIIHHCNRQLISADAENPHFLLTNRRSDYLALGNPNHSNYDGFFVKLADGYYKILHNIAPISATKSIEIESSAVRHAESGIQEFLMLEEGMLMEGTGRFVLTLDCKRLYDESDQGRIYEVEDIHPVDAYAASELLAQAHLFDVRYTKRAGQQYELHVAIATSMRAQQIGRWREAQYEYDLRRGTRNTPWVYDMLELSGSGTVAVAAAQTSEEARRRAVTLLMTQVRHAIRDACADIPALPARAQLAWRSLASLRTRTGIMAGLPWFFHEWSRDELISAGGLLAARKYDAVISILDKWYGAIRPDGTLPAIYPDQGLPSSDAPGWLGKRTRDLLLRLSDEGILHDLPQEKIASWRDATGALIDRCATRIHDGLIWSDANTTWMDTSSNDDGRAGARIEIQALFLALCDCHAYLCTITRTRVDPGRSELARNIIDGVHSRLVHDGVLLDGLHADAMPDYAVRPNIFLAQYIAPKLFSDDEWKRFFAAGLPKLWLEWGGLASIDKAGQNFHDRYTGEDVASYHRGDSWFFINNIAAMAMHSVDSAGFRHEVRSIIDTSMRDLLSQGFAGHCSEVSSAGQQEACGCHAQAWSASTLLEALLLVERN
jgi:hypothetical protein